ncbi:hypothetical protein Ahy_A04g020277 [Arachis hypogaea]|uniref:Protein FAR1-RELATED SEQUENCE n=1 Tax=Arachis hypogaea TaxID=3818 RepID=A0A445DHC7_ARAHY|nr:hypothetical protein Ahy_A04g020277 [Arachis hypogaea]
MGVFIVLTRCIVQPLSVVDDELVPKVEITFITLEDAGKFYRNYAKAAGFSTRKSKIFPIEKTNLTAGLNCPARIYIHTLKDVGAWIISKVVLDHSHPCCPSKAEMLKQHRELSMSIRRMIENNDEAVHRWCIWHIMKKIPSKLNGYKGHADIEQEMSHVVWNSHSKDSFDRNWNDFLLNFGLADNKWLSGNVFLKSAAEVYIVCSLGCILQSVFGEQAERESDAADFHMVIPCATKSSIEAQFQDAYTHGKFREVQAQFRGKANCITRLKNSALGYSIYEVGEQVSSSIFNKFAVTYDSVAAEVKCQCLLFESRGILCRHALSVLSFEQVSQVSPRYILEQWSKKVKRRHTHIKSSHDEPLIEPRSKRFDQLVFHSQNICEFASESKELTAILHRAYDNVMAEMEALKAKRKETSSLSHEDANLESARFKAGETDCKCHKEEEDESFKRGKSNINLFDAASAAHSNSSQYQGHVMNYQFRVPAARDNSLGV